MKTISALYHHENRILSKQAIRYLTTIVFGIFLFCLKVHAVGESAVITLEFPAGAENTGLGETGVSIANTISSVFWNPANAASFYEQLHVNHIYTDFHEKLLPSLRIPDLYHEFNAFSTTLNNVLPHIDLGYAYFRNYIFMGENTIYDSLGYEVLTTKSSEEVTSNCIGIRGFDILSLGVSFKRFDSRLAPGIGGAERPNDGIAKGRAFDLGIRINKKIDILGLFYMNPSIGASALNFGNDSAIYIKRKMSKNPIPRKGIIGGSCELNLLDLFGYTFVYEEDFNLLTHPNERIKHSGHKFQITPFYAILRGKMTDTAGERFERTEGYVINVNFRQTFQMISKVVKLLDIINKTDYYSKMMRRENILSIYGFDFKPNFYFSKCNSVIYGAKSDQVREGQTRDDWSIGVGIIGGFPNLFKKRCDDKNVAKEKSESSGNMIILEENTNEIVQ